MSESTPQRIVRPPADAAERGKDEVEHGWGDSQTDVPRRPDEAEREFIRRHNTDRPPHHDSDWG